MKPGPQFDALYHGTVHDIDDDRDVGVPMVMPPSTTGVRRRNIRTSNWLNRGQPTEVEGYDAREHASVSEHERAAWDFAKMSSARGDGRARVYEVGTTPDMKMGLEHSGNRKVRRESGFTSGGNTKEWISPSGFPVQGRVDIMPPEDKRVPNTFLKYAPNPRGRQGTLPLDWHPFAADVAYEPRPGVTAHYKPNSMSINHPTESERLAQAANRPPDPESFKKPPEYIGGQKLPDDFSERKRTPRSVTGNQPMLPGMRGAVKRVPKKKAAS